MAVTEPPLPVPLPTSNLRKARDIVVERVQAWMGGHAKHTTMGHSGPVTQAFIVKQAGMAPRSIVTVTDGTSFRIGNGMSIQCIVTFGWFVIVRGLIKDRTTDALDFVGESLRFVYADVSRDDDPDKIFSKPPAADSVRFASRYIDKDEQTAYTIWAIQWQQEISLGAAGRERPGDGILLLINGTDEYPGDPNGDEVRFQVT
jgi:hypothetical protein